MAGETHWSLWDHIGLAMCVVPGPTPQCTFDTQLRDSRKEKTKNKKDQKSVFWALGLTNVDRLCVLRGCPATKPLVG